MSMSEAFIVTVAGMVIVMVELALLAVIIVIMSKMIRKLSPDKDVNKTESAPISPVSPVPIAISGSTSDGSVILQNIDDKSAAMVMAIVSDDTGIPLNELRFRSIKALD
ncbi:MAG: OadG family protein [Clostridiales bacterium]|nr:OadG family protein [Clostridiales bacterium]